MMIFATLLLVLIFGRGATTATFVVLVFARRRATLLVFVLAAAAAAAMLVLRTGTRTVLVPVFVPMLALMAPFLVPVSIFIFVIRFVGALLLPVSMLRLVLLLTIETIGHAIHMSICKKMYQMYYTVNNAANKFAFRSNSVAFIFSDCTVQKNLRYRLLSTQ